MVTIEMQYSNGTWGEIDENRREQFVQCVVKHEMSLAERHGDKYESRFGRSPLVSAEQVIEYMTSNPGAKISYGSDWYENIRVPQPPMKTAREQAIDEAQETNMPVKIRTWTDYEDSDGEQSHVFTEFAMPNRTTKTETKTVWG